MTDAEHAFWEAYLRRLADLLGLRDWRVLLWRDRSESGSLATIEITRGAREFVVNLGARWAALDADRQRQCLVHELIHAHTNEITERVREASEKFGDNSLMGYLPDLIRHEIEHAVDALAEVIAPHLPLPGETA